PAELEEGGAIVPREEAWGALGVGGLERRALVEAPERRRVKGDRAEDLEEGLRAPPIDDLRAAGGGGAAVEEGAGRDEGDGRPLLSEVPDERRQPVDPAEGAARAAAGGEVALEVRHDREAEVRRREGARGRRRLVARLLAGAARGGAAGEGEREREEGGEGA